MVLGKFHTAAEKGARSCGQGTLPAPPCPIQPPGNRVPHTPSPPWGRATPTGTALPPGCWCRVPAPHEQPEIPGGRGAGREQSTLGCPSPQEGTPRSPHAAATAPGRAGPPQPPDPARAGLKPCVLPAGCQPPAAPHGRVPLPGARAHREHRGCERSTQGASCRSAGCTGTAAVSPAAISGAAASGGSGEKQPCPGCRTGCTLLGPSPAGTHAPSSSLQDPAHHPPLQNLAT